MGEIVTISEEELSSCPECNEALSTDSPEFLGGGLMVIQVYCSSCDFYATEEWEHSETVFDEGA